MEENFPVSETLKIIKGKTIFKSDSWWSAVILLNSFGRKQIATYLWQKNNNNVWKRRQKFVVSNKDNWNKYKDTIDEYLPEIE